jgi:Flp pilus assembly protein TadD
VIRLAAVAWAGWLAWRFTAKVWDPAGMRRITLEAVGPPWDWSDAAGTWAGHGAAALAAGGTLLTARGWGFAVARWMRLRGPLVPHAGLGLGLVALGLAVYGAGLTGLLRPACLLLLAVPGLPGFVRWRSGTAAPPAGSAPAPVAPPSPTANRPDRAKFDRMGKGGTKTAAPAVRAAWRTRFAGRDWPSALLAAACGPLLLLSLVPALAPELGWDALTYHLRVPDHWLAAGRIHVVPFSLGSFYPFLAETWFIPAMAFGGDGGAKLVNWAMLPLVAAALVRLGRGLGVPAAGWAGAVLWCGTPGAQVVAGQAYNDLEVAWLSVLLGAATLARGPAWRLAAGVLLGGAAGCKMTAAWVGLGCAGAWAWREWRGERRWARGVLLPGFVSLAVFAVWPARNWLWTGNPVFPMLPGAFPDAGWNPWYTAAEAARIVPGAVPQGVLEVARGLIRLPYDFATFYQVVGVYFGPIAVLFLPALLLPGPRPVTWRFAALGGATAALWELSRGGDSRYLLPAAALLALPAGEGFIRLAGRWLTGLPAVAACGAVLAVLSAHFAAYESRMYAPWRVALGSEPRFVYLSRAMLPNHEYYPMALRVNGRLAARDRVLLVSDIVSHYHRPFMVFDTQQVMPPIGVRWARRGLEPARLRRRLRQLGIGWVFHSSRLIAFEKECRCTTVEGPARDRWRAFWRRYADLEIEYGGLRLYRLRGEAEARRVPPPPFLTFPGGQEAAFALAEEARRTNDWTAAERALRELVRREPDLAEPRFKLAEVLLLTARPAKAKREAAAARRLGLDSGALRLLEAGIAAAHGDRDGARRAARDAARIWPAPRPLAIAAATAWDMGDREEALARIREALRLNPWDPEVRRIADRLK